MQRFPLRELALSYDKGNLVPFLGSGMSYPACAGWRQMVESLERAAQIVGLGEDLPARVDRAVQRLRNRGTERFVRALKKAVYVDPDADLFSANALVDLSWPLVVTTNYDSLFLDRYNKRYYEDPPKGYYCMEVVGRERGDCQRVLNSARTADRPLLWAIQGHFGPAKSKDIHPLCDQLTVGDTDYRRQTQNAVNFRRAFAEIYRSKTLLFLGSGMSETYFRHLFGEIIQLYGNCPHLHHALIKKGTLPDIRGFERQFGVRLYEWESPSEVATAIKQLASEVKDSLRPKTSSWNYWLFAKGAAGTPGFMPDVEIKRSRLPSQTWLTDSEAIAFSAGNGPAFGDDTLKWLRDAEISVTDFRLVPQRDERLLRAGDRRVYAVIARDESGSDTRDPRVIADLVQELFAEVEMRFPSMRVVNVMLLASGSGRKFPQHVALIEMIWGYKGWREKSQSPTHLCMRIHVVDPTPISLLTSGRVDIVRLLNEQQVSFWVEVQEDNGDFQRFIETRPEDTAVAELAGDYDVLLDGWGYTVSPPLRLDENARNVKPLQASDTLHSEGVFFGSTVRFSRRK